MKSLLVLLFFITATTAYSQNSADTFIYSYTNTLKIGYTYWGPVKAGIPEGAGIALYSYGGKNAFYKGGFKKGLRSGAGMLHLATGGHFEGVWAGDTLTGAAKLYDNTTGNYYIGGVDKEGSYNGNGTVYTVLADVYKGNFTKTGMNGYGIIARPNGDYYQGNFINSSFTGEGIITAADGTKKSGIYKDAVLITPQTITLPAVAATFKKPTEILLRDYKNTLKNIFTYWGTVKDSMPNGFGFANYYYSKTLNEMYVGNFKNGLRNGKGEMYYKNGDYFTGEWANDSLLRGTIYYCAGGSFYTGDFKHNKKEGIGTEKYSYGTTYSGGFKNGLYHNAGNYKTTYGNSYKGNYANGYKDGQGKEIEGATIREGLWEKGKFKGVEVYKLPAGTKAFVGINTVATNKIKSNLTTLLTTYKADKLASLKDKPVVSKDTIVKKILPKIKLSGNDTIFIKKGNVFYSAYFGTIASEKEAINVFDELKKWMNAGFFTNTNSIDWYLHDGYSTKSQGYTDADKSAGMILYILKKNGAYEVRIAVSALFLSSGSNYNYDEDDWWW